MAINPEFKRIKELASEPLKTDQEMQRVEVVMMVYNEHELVADVIGLMIKYANYPFKLTVLDNTRQITPINFSRVWNDRIRKCEGDFIAFCDSDIFVRPDWLKRLMESFADPACDVSVPVLNKTSCKQQQASEEASYPTTEILKEILAAQLVVYRKSVFDRIGYFDERFLLYGQDSEWGWRFLRHPEAGTGVIRRDVFIDHVGSYSLNKFAEANKELYNASAEREYARQLFQHLIKKHETEH